MCICVCVSMLDVYSVSSLKPGVPALVLKPAHSRGGLCKAVGGWSWLWIGSKPRELLTKHMCTYTQTHKCLQYRERLVPSGAVLEQHKCEYLEFFKNYSIFTFKWLQWEHGFFCVCVWEVTFASWWWEESKKTASCKMFLRKSKSYKGLKKISINFKYMANTA